MRGKKRPPAERNRAVALAEVQGVEKASDATGVPQRTIRLWMNDPRYAELRQKTREELAEGFKALAHLSLSQLLEQVRAGLVEPRDLTILLGVATDKHLVMSGQATARTESKDISHDLDPDTRERITRWLDERLDPDPGRADGVPEGDSAEVR